MNVTELTFPYNQQQRPFNGAEEVFGKEYDTAGNLYWYGSRTWHHGIKRST